MNRLGLFLVILLTGCAVGPKYQRPAVESPSAWKEFPIEWKQSTPAAVPEQEAWWEIFGDPALNDLESQALSANLDLKMALARLDQAKAVARVSAAELLPTLDFSGSYSHFQRTLSSFGGTGFIKNDTYSIPFDLSYEVDLWGRVRRSFEASRAEAEATADAYYAARLSIGAEVASDYFLLRQLDKELKILNETVELRKEGLDIVSRRVDAGLASELDAVRARAEMATAEAEIADVERRRAEFEHALAVLCAQVPADFTVRKSAADAALPYVPAGVPSQLLERRPDVAESERLVAAANARIGVAQAAFFPVLRLTGSAGYEAAEFDMLFKSTSEVWALGPSVSVPLFAGGRNRANLKASKAAHEESVARYRKTVLTAFQEVENALVNLRRRAEQHEAQSRALDAVRQAASLSNARYEEGMISYLEVVDAERSRLEAERLEAQIRSQQMVSTVLLIKSLGGSWQAAGPEQEGR